MRSFLFLPVLLLYTISAFAQWDAKVSTGVVAIQTQDYDKAIVALKEAIAHEDELREKNVIKAYYNLADALIRESQKQMSIKGENVERKYADYMFEAVDVLVKARTFPDEEDRFKSQIEIRVNTVFNSLLMSVVQLTNSAASVNQNEKIAYFQEMLKVCSAMVRLKPEHYMAYDYRGQTYLSLNDSAKAYTDLKTGIELYERSALDGPDAMAGYMYYRAALIDAYGYKNRVSALNFLQAGLNKIKSDRKLIEEATNMTDEVKRDVLDKFYATKQDLKLFRLDLLLKAPTISDTELKELENGIKEFPDNVNVRLGYAQRIQLEKPDAAIKIYDQVLAKEPNNVTALFNAGVLYYNRAANLSKQLAADENAMRTDEALVSEYFRQAIPYFEKALQLGETSSKGILTTISKFLDDQELLNKYGE